MSDGGYLSDLACDPAPTDKELLWRANKTIAELRAKVCALSAEMRDVSTPRLSLCHTHRMYYFDWQSKPVCPRERYEALRRFARVHRMYHAVCRNH